MGHRQQGNGGASNFLSFLDLEAPIKSIKRYLREFLNGVSMDLSESKRYNALDTIKAINTRSANKPSNWPSRYPYQAYPNILQEL